MKILWASNAPWAPSGYGGQTLQVVRRLKAAGHDIAIAANFGIQASSIEHESLPGVPILPALYDGIGNDILPAHYRAWADHKQDACPDPANHDDGPGVLITLYDVWPYARERFADLPISSWVPVDHYPAPRPVVEWCTAHRAIAMSRFGEARLLDGLVTHYANEVDPEGRLEGPEREQRAVAAMDAADRRPVYIPHAIETSVFQPIEGARAELGWDPDAFYVLINAANKGANMRKAWSEMFGALALFMAAHPDVRVHLHTERIGAQSPDLQQILDAWRIDSSRVAWSPQYSLKKGDVSAADVARLYSAADVLLATSKGEGFGIPVIEAQACGLPVIVANWTAQPELVGGGWVADVQPDWDPVQSAFFATPIISSIQARLEDAYAARGDAQVWQALRGASVARGAEYDADKIFVEGWVPYIASLEERQHPPNRQERRRRKRAAA